MEKRIVFERYPVFILHAMKDETDCADIDSVVGYFRRCVDDHRFARFIAVFDHYEHTSALGEGEISDDVLDAKCVVFCFGMSIPNAEILALRPRSIGVAELRDRFVVSFLETPMPLANTAMERWATGLLRAPYAKDKAHKSVEISSQPPG